MNCSHLAKPLRVVYLLDRPFCRAAPNAGWAALSLAVTELIRRVPPGNGGTVTTSQAET
jgi:hypothetical protein